MTRRDDLEETQYLGKPLHDGTQQPAGRTRKLDDTQSLPSLDGTSINDGQSHPRRPSNVRELSPVGTLQSHSTQDPKGTHPGNGADDGKPPFWTKTKKRNAILAGGFLFALLLGFILAGYTQQNAQRAENERMHQEQQLTQQQEKLAKDTKALEEKKAQLEQEKRDLETQKQQAADTAARAQGRNEQLQQEASSGLGKLIDKVTGKEKKQKEAQAANEQTAASAQTDAANIDQSIQNAQQMLDDVNAKLDAAKSVQQDASAALEKAQTAYDENRDTIDTIVSYAKTGAQMLGHLLFQ